MKKVILPMLASAVVIGAYYAGTRQSEKAPEPPATRTAVIPIVGPAEPMNITLENPTAVLLGEAKVPENVFAPR